MRVLPRPFELKCGEFGRKAMHYHLHDPWPVVLRLPSTLGEFAIMLTNN